MTVQLTLGLPVYRGIAPGVYLCHGEGRSPGDVSGGNNNITFSPWPTGTGQSGGGGEMWFPLWMSVAGPASTLVYITRSGAILWAPASWEDDTFFTTLDAYGRLAVTDQLTLRTFLRKPYRARFGAIGGANGFYFTTANGAGATLTASLWALRIVEAEADWEKLLALIAIL